LAHLCPKDYSPLGLVHNEDKDMSIRWDVLISDSYYHYQLFCPECDSRFTLGEEAKELSKSREQVEGRFQGIRNRQAN
jgi:hypothetical protein